MCGKLYFHISLHGLGILSKIFGKIKMEIGKNGVLVALGTGPIFGPKMGLEESLNLNSNKDTTIFRYSRCRSITGIKAVQVINKTNFLK